MNSKWYLGGVLLVVIVMLSACGGENSDTNETKDPHVTNQPSATNSTNPTSPTTQPVEVEKKANAIDPAKNYQLTFYQTSSGWTEERFMDMYGDNIKLKFPNVTLKFIPSGNPIPELLAANAEMDILFSSIGNMHATMLKYEMQHDISGLIKSNHYDLNQFEPVTIDLIKQVGDGGIYGLPVSLSPFMLLYNRDIFDKFGIPYPKDGMTWDETYDLARIMTRTDSGVTYRGFVSSFSHWFLTNQLSASYVDPKTNKPLFETEPGWKKAMENMLRFYTIQGNEVDAQTVTSAKQNEFFVKETAAMKAQIGFPNETIKVNWDAAVLPVYKELPGVGPQPYPIYFNIPTISKNKEVAFQVIAYMASEEYQMKLSKKGQVTALKNTKVQGVFGQEAAHLQGKNLKAFFPEKMAKPSLMSPYTRFATAPLNNVMNEVAIGKTDINTALRTAAEKVEIAITAETAK